MLESKLSAIKTTFTAIKFGFIPVYLIIMYLASVLFKIEASDRAGFIWVWVIGGILLYGYFLFKFLTMSKCLEKYIICLKNREFQNALHFGRTYYSVRRKGLFGLDGSGLTVYDEQAMNNDINAYSKV